MAMDLAWLADLGGRSMCICMCTERQNAEKPISLRRRAFASAPLKANTCKFSAKLLCNKRRRRRSRRVFVRARLFASCAALHVRAGPGFVVRARAIYEKYGGNKPALNAKHFFVSRSITFKQQHEWKKDKARRTNWKYLQPKRERDWRRQRKNRRKNNISWFPLCAPFVWQKI